MYKKACKEALNYIRPIIIGKKYYNNDTIINDIGTVIVLNKNGDILTTKELAENIYLSIDTNSVFKNIFLELKNKKIKEIKKIEKKYSLDNNVITNLQVQIVDVAESITNIEIIPHEYLNLAIIKSENKGLFINKFPNKTISRYSITMAIIVNINKEISMHTNCMHRKNFKFSWYIVN